jgi:hypothetical protein
MGSLLTFAAGALPLVCDEKEFAVLVLLPVSACRVVVAGGIVPVGVVEVGDPPQEARSDPNTIKQRRKVAVFTETTPTKLMLALVI